MIDVSQCKLFLTNISTLKEISKDSSDMNNIQYMTDSQIEVIDFDMVKRNYANNLSLSEECAKSVDGIVFWNDELTFIEFKNGKMANEKSNIKRKILDSLLIFCDIVGKNINFTREKVIFILVYNEQKNSKYMIAKKISDKANKEFIKFGLEEFKKLYFKNVHTYTENEFNSYIKRKIT